MIRSSVVQILALYMLLCGAESVRGDILFLDLNNNPDEIAAATRAAEKLGEKLVIHPTPAEKERAKIETTRQEWVKAEMAVRYKCAKKDSPQPCTDAQVKFDEIDNRYDDLTDKINLNKSALPKVLAADKKAGLHFDKIIISGHQENSEHFGVFGDLKFSEIAKAFKKYGTCDDVQAIYPFGCSTVSQKGIMEEKWKDVCPNLKLIGAYNGQGPLGYMKANKVYLEGLITKTDEIIQAKTKEDAQAVFKTIEYVNNAQVGLKAGICLNSDVIITNTSISSISEALRNCKELSNKKLEDKYVCYKNGLPGCEDLPAVTNGGPLREFYAYLNDTHACNDVLAEAGHVRPPSESVLRLIFDKNVRTNFETIYKPELDKMNALITDLGIAPEFRLEGLGALSRKDYVAKMKGLKKAYNQLFNKIKDKNGDVDDPGIATLGFYMSEIDNLSDPACVPSRWIDPRAHNDSECGMREKMDSAEARGQAYADRIYKQHLKSGYHR